MATPEGTKVPPDWIQATKTRFPTLFRDIHPFNFDCGPGWSGIVTGLCENLATLALPELRVAQIKEKFGRLRFYVDGGNHEVEALIEQAESASGRTCECCGGVGRQYIDGWILTLCESCQAERKTKA